MGSTILDKSKVAEWVKAAPVEGFQKDAGSTILLNGKQIAVFYFSDKDEWYATQNQCPHKLEMALSRGLIGDEGGAPKVACPFHKKSFSLKTGECLSGDDYQIEIFPLKIVDSELYIGFPSKG